MLEQIDGQPDSERPSAVLDRDRHIDWRKRRTDMGGHVVERLQPMPVKVRVTRHWTPHEAFGIGKYLPGSAFSWTSSDGVLCPMNQVRNPVRIPERRTWSAAAAVMS